MVTQRKVLHLVSSTGLYGAETVILNLSKEMQHSSFSPVVGMICEDKDTLPQIGTAAQELGLETATFYSSNRFDVLCVKNIHNYLEKNNISIVHSHGYKPSILSYLPCRLLNKPLIITCHLWFNIDDNKLKLYHKIETMVMKKIPAVIGVSNEICNELITAGVDKDNVHCIFNGIDLSNYRQYPMSETNRVFTELGIQKDEFVIGSIGRLHEQKAFHYVLEAVDLLKRKNNALKLKCVVFGDGPLREELKGKCSRLGLQKVVQFPGFREDILNLLDFMDVFVISSVDEGLPMVLLEAMAKKKAIISTPVGAINSVLTHEKDALLFEVGDVQTLARYIDLLQKEPALRNRIAQQAYQRFKKDFSAKIMTSRYIDLYESVLN